MNTGAFKTRTYTTPGLVFRAGETMTIYKLSETPKFKINGSSSVYKFLQESGYFPFCDSHETMYAILMNRSNHIIAVEKLGEGSQSGLVSDNMRLYSAVILNKAHGVILTHNHPGGTLYPSAPDINLTEGVKEVLKLFNVKLYDHIIYTQNGYYSFADDGRI